MQPTLPAVIRNKRPHQPVARNCAMVSDSWSINCFIFNIVHKRFRAGLGYGQVVDLRAPLHAQSALRQSAVIRPEGVLDYNRH
jgi:hypothetical protein